MAEGQKRTHLQAVADAKARDALLLLQNGRFSNAYYLGGYSIEIGLKACIARRITAQVIPDKNFIQRIHTHELKTLVGLAGLSAELKEELTGNQDFATYWGIAGEWTPESRYAEMDEYSAQLLVQGVNDPDAGILRWIRLHW